MSFLSPFTLIKLANGMTIKASISIKIIKKLAANLDSVEKEMIIAVINSISASVRQCLEIGLVSNL
ncbi:MAG: hypothetical protein ACJAVX_003414 [Pseudoalteromonas rhizosphaerae]|jgi:hypothetical protein|tara:strand:+ start:294 stop:491 length:198 start_codon:yes stop_codon:yes gene_type:complete